MTAAAWVAIAATIVALAVAGLALRRATRLKAALAAASARLDAQAAEHEQALRLAHERATFIAEASHDLRQPIHAFGLFVAALRAEPLSTAAEAMLDRMGRALRGMDELFQRVLDVSRLDAGAVVARPRTFPLAPLAAALEARLAPVATERGLRLRVACDDALVVVADPALVAELLTNLMTNAIRYTDRGGVLLACRPLGADVRVQVCDTGRGIAPEDQQRIFEPFVQLDNLARDRRRGSGLGLAIVRRLADALGRPLTLRSRPGRGTRVTLSLPRGPDRVVVPAADEDVASPLAGALVLVVDDEVDVLVATRAALASWGCHVLIARDGEEAVRGIQDCPRFPDLLLTDHELGAERSEDVIAAVQAQLPEPVPVVVLGAGAPPPDASLRTSTVRWLAKPIDAQALRDALADALGAAQL